MKNLIQALIKSQKEIKNAAKDAKNPHFRNDYATLESVIEAVKNIANANELAVVQLQGKDDKGDYVETKILHSSGEEMASRCYLSLDKPTMQGLGSAITYARRYNLAAIFCITQADDDDGNYASGNQYSPPKEPLKPVTKTDALDSAALVGKLTARLGELTKDQPKEMKMAFLKKHLGIEGVGKLLGWTNEQLLESLGKLNKL